MGYNLLCDQKDFIRPVQLACPPAPDMLRVKPMNDALVSRAGLILFMFLMGLELDRSLLRTQFRFRHVYEAHCPGFQHLQPHSNSVFCLPS
jgi:hypothetical protein